jgi:hypothetical protein
MIASVLRAFQLDGGALTDEITVGWNKRSGSTLRHVFPKYECARLLLDRS